MSNMSRSARRVALLASGLMALLGAVAVPAGAVTVSIPPGAFSSAVDVTLSVPASFPAGGGPAEN